MIVQDKIMISMILMSMHILSYAASVDQKSEESDMWQVIAKTSQEKELIDTGRYALFKMIHKVYSVVDPDTDLNEIPIPEFKKNADNKLYLVFRDPYGTSPSDICMLWGRIRLKRWSREQEQKISFLVRNKLKVTYQDYYKGYTCYEIIKVEGDPLPAQIKRVNEPSRSIRDIAEEWHQLRMMYKREQNIKWLTAHMELCEIKEGGVYDIQS